MDTTAPQFEDPSDGPFTPVELELIAQIVAEHDLADALLRRPATPTGQAAAWVEVGWDDAASAADIEAGSAWVLTAVHDSEAPDDGSDDYLELAAIYGRPPTARELDVRRSGPVFQATLAAYDQYGIRGLSLATGLTGEALIGYAEVLLDDVYPDLVDNWP